MTNAARPPQGPVLGVIVDWAGTTIDFGSRAPVAAFRATFQKAGVEITIAEARAPMGQNKRDHIRAITQMARVAAAWQSAHGKLPDEADVLLMYEAFVPVQLGCLRDYSQVIGGTVETMAELRRRGIRIGSTSGYSRQMIDVLAPLAAAQGFQPDSIVCASDVPQGRPSPFMVWLAALQIGLYPLSRALKIGDTLADIDEGRSAGMWTVGLTRCGNELGLSEAEAAALPAPERSRLLVAAAQRLRAAGAHYVAETFADCLPIIDDVNRRLANGEVP